MIRRILTTRFASNLDYTRRLIDGMSEEHANVLPADGMNSPRWIVGHLAQTADMVTLGWVFEAERSIDSWDAWFNGGTTSAALTAEQPSLAEAMVHLERLHASVSERVEASSPAWFEKSAPGIAPDAFRQRFPTIGNALAHTMLSHEMMHLGQLSAWRRVQGLPAV
ncbi:MAG: DinB family protein [Planctomycetota bacterium]